MKKIGLALVAVALTAGCDRLPFTPQAIARDAMLKTLNDPDSAKFTYLAVSDHGVCGLVNSRNRMGGYAGSRPFSAAILAGKAYVSIMPDQVDWADYQRWKDGADPDGSLFLKLQDACTFPQDWALACDKAALPLEAQPDDKTCLAWKTDTDARVAASKKAP